MLKKKFRLSGLDIKNIFANKYKKFASKDWLIIYKENNLGYPRFSVSPRTSIFKKAVERNKIRRLVYKFIRELMQKEKISSYDFLIIIQNKEIDLEKLKEFLKNV